MTELRNIRKARGLSQNGLAALSGVAATTLSDYERGVSTPSVATLVKLADSLECSTDRLLGRAGDAA